MVFGLNFKSACRMCVGRLLNRPLSYFRRVTGRDLFIISNLDAELIPVGYRFMLDRYVGLGLPGVFWAVDVRRLMERAGPTSVDGVVRELNCIVLEEVCHYLGWLHRRDGRLSIEVEFFRKIVNEYMRH